MTCNSLGILSHRIALWPFWCSRWETCLWLPGQNLTVLHINKVYLCLHILNTCWRFQKNTQCVHWGKFAIVLFRLLSRVQIFQKILILIATLLVVYVANAHVTVFQLPHSWFLSRCKHLTPSLYHVPKFIYWNSY
jgi:hypothetical protein